MILDARLYHRPARLPGAPGPAVPQRKGPGPGRSPPGTFSRQQPSSPGGNGGQPGGPTRRQLHGTPPGTGRRFPGTPSSAFAPFATSALAPAPLRACAPRRGGSWGPAGACCSRGPPHGPAAANGKAGPYARHAPRCSAPSRERGGGGSGPAHAPPCPAAPSAWLRAVCACVPPAGVCLGSAAVEAAEAASCAVEGGGVGGVRAGLRVGRGLSPGKEGSGCHQLHTLPF